MDESAKKKFAKTSERAFFNETLAQRSKPMGAVASRTATSNTSDILLETIEALSETARVQASMGQSSSRLDTKLVRSVKELAIAWSTVHGEIRSSIQAMTDEEYLSLLARIQSARAGEPAPLHPGVLKCPNSAFEPHTNFQKTPTLNGADSSTMAIFQAKAPPHQQANSGQDPLLAPHQAQPIAASISTPSSSTLAKKNEPPTMHPHRDAAANQKPFNAIKFKETQLPHLTLKKRILDFNELEQEGETK